MMRRLVLGPFRASDGKRHSPSGQPHRFLLCCLLCVLLSACKVPLHSGLSEDEANEMLSKLLEYNIDAVKQTNEANQVTLLVDELQFGEAVELLKSFGLPRPRYATMGEVFTGDGLMTSPVQEWARFNFALSQELSSMVSSIPGVISAEVHIANPRKETPFEETSPPSASVLALVSREAITAELVPQIKQLVAYGIEKVDYERVGVVVSPVDPPARPDVDLASFGGVVMLKNSRARAIILTCVIAAFSLASGAGAMFAAGSYLKTRKERAA